MSNNKDFKVKNGIQPTVYQEGVGTVVSGSEGYYLSGASYDSVSYNNVSEEPNVLGLFFKSDGTKLYTIGGGGDSIDQYSLSTAYDLSTISYDSVTLSLNSQDTTPTALHFKPDGTKMYFIGLGSDTAYQYTLSTAWDLSTASYDSVSLSVTSQDTAPYGLSFKSDGTKMYVAGLTNQSIFQYTLSTAWDLSTASYDSVSYNVARNMSEVKFKPDGTEMYISSITEQEIVGFLLSTAWDISTASYLSETNTSADIPNPRGFDFNSDGTKMIVADNSIDYLYQVSTVLTTNTLDLSTGSVFEITPTSDIQVSLTNPAASGTSSGATLLLNQQGYYGGYSIESPVDTGKSVVLNTVASPSSFFLGSSGTKLYTTSATNNAVYQYTLSTAYDISTASYDSVSLSIVGQQDDAYAITFKPDGTIMYITDVGATDSVFQYTLSTAWDLSTASYASKSFSFGSQDTFPEGISFNADGTKMYMIGRTGDAVYQYTLSTAYDVSTASYDSVSFSVASQDATPFGLEFNSSGTKMYVLGSAGTSIYQYSLSTAFDISSASYDSISYDYTSVASTVYDFTFNNTGSKLYIMSNTSAFELDSVSSATITYPSTLQWSGGTAPTSPAIGETDVLTFNTTDGGTTYQAVQAINGAK
jgi:6-phosphogluconolactonase (cycloisomerase 2 family)